MNQKKKSSYDAKKEKLLNIKKQIKYHYDFQEMYKNDKYINNEAKMRVLIDLIWEIVKNEKDK